MTDVKERKKTVTDRQIEGETPGVERATGNERELVRLIADSRFVRVST